MNNSMVLKSLLTLALFSLVVQAPAQVSPAERAALSDFYHATGGSDWHESQRWLAAGNECNWYGVQCAGPAGDRFVLRLMLEDNNLTGQLPESLAGLDRLRTLLLNDNHLEGTLSTELWGLTNLSDLLLSGNQFTGEVPAAILDMLPGAPRTQVNLADNLLDGYGLDHLDEQSFGAGIQLSLEGNLLTNLPPAAWRETGAIETLNLSGNLIEGALVFDDRHWPGLHELNLSDNLISELSELNADYLPDLRSLVLKGNRLETLPESLTTFELLRNLEVGNNRLAGELPEWFENLNLARLGLDNNDLSGPIARLFAAMNLDKVAMLHAGNNRFFGPLPDIDYGAFNSPIFSRSPELGLDLCFNDIELPDAAMLASIDSVHRGLALAACLGRDQMAIDPTISGSWFTPERDGEGLTQMLLENGKMLSYWFTYGTREHGAPPEQRWLFGLSEPGESWIESQPLLATSGGLFQHGLVGGALKPSRTWMRQNRLDADNLHFFYDFSDSGICITGGCSWDVRTERFDLTRLTRIAGTSCDTRTELQQYSGAWFNPERDGEGFIVEMLPDNRVVVYWFTYLPDGSGKQAWMTGVGQIEPGPPMIGLPPSGDRIEFLIQVDSLYQPQGAVFGPNFNPADIELVDWGKLTVALSRSDAGWVQWVGLDPAYGSGSYPIERLARPMLAQCDDD